MPVCPQRMLLGCGRVFVIHCGDATHLELEECVWVSGSGAGPHELNLDASEQSFCFLVLGPFHVVEMV